MSAVPPPATGNPSQGAVTPLCTLAGSSLGSAEEGGLENAGKLIDQHMAEDRGFRELSGQFMIRTHSEHTFDVWGLRVVCLDLVAVVYTTCW